MLLPVLLVSSLLPSGALAGEIIGGWKAKPHSKPYMAFVQIVTQSGKGFECGGFLVQEDFVLTAAHCIPEGQSAPQRWENNAWVMLGAHDRSKTEKNRQEIAVRRMIPHEDYNRKTHKNDIMLLQQCKQLYRSFNSTSMICTGHRGDKKSPFKGDSGGPLVCNSIAQGIVSFSTACGLPPTFYTRISAYINWIEENMGQE
ncbi:granzyme H [Alligator mississippiensis]|uniref:Granzyme H n=1 Tax=Alligator mississippiensis TaxID=8496 RepID=A0A151NH79_ALLMI|nr:granzyme H [Alligator mississippiensis]